MKPVLYRYKDTESVIKVMDGYTPGDGWEPLYGSDEVKAATDAALERAALVCDEQAKEPECPERAALAAPAAAPEPICTKCGDVITAHDPGLCGCCLSTRDTTTPVQPSWQDAPTKPGMWACLYMGELSTAIFNAYEIEHFYASEMGGCRWQFIPDEDKP